MYLLRNNLLQNAAPWPNVMTDMCGSNCVAQHFRNLIFNQGYEVEGVSGWDLMNHKLTKKSSQLSD